MFANTNTKKEMFKFVVVWGILRNFAKWNGEEESVVAATPASSFSAGLKRHVQGSGRAVGRKAAKREVQASADLVAEAKARNKILQAAMSERNAILYFASLPEDNEIKQEFTTRMTARMMVAAFRSLKWRRKTTAVKARRISS